MEILLHICCAPCLIYPQQRLKERGFLVKGLYYNPNIHPFSEYRRRKGAVETLAVKSGLELFCPEYRPAEFFRQINLHEEPEERCVLCWSLRMRQAAQAAKEKGIPAFTTTLLVSPYQDQGLLRRSAEEAAAAEGVEFYYEDFRPGFREAHRDAKAEGIYCQNYCGCIYSEIERCRKSAKH